jgi:hypothetical protein
LVNALMGKAQESIFLVHPGPIIVPGSQYLIRIYLINNWIDDPGQTITSCKPRKCLKIFCF